MIKEHIINVYSEKNIHLSFYYFMSANLYISRIERKRFGVAVWSFSDDRICFLRGSVLEFL